MGKSTGEAMFGIVDANCKTLAPAGQASRGAFDALCPMADWPTWDVTTLGGSRK